MSGKFTRHHFWNRAGIGAHRISGGSAAVSGLYHNFRQRRGILSRLIVRLDGTFTAPNFSENIDVAQTLLVVDMVDDFNDLLAQLGDRVLLDLRFNDALLSQSAFLFHLFEGGFESVGGRTERRVDVHDGKLLLTGLRCNRAVSLSQWWVTSSLMRDFRQLVNDYTNR
jgi:hypothetical protein